MKNIIAKLVIVGLSIGAGACGSDDPVDNVASCEAYVEALDCGSFDITSVYPANFCDGYGNISCDVSDYFDCLTSNITCVLDDPLLGDHLDLSGTVACASKANCD